MYKENCVFIVENFHTFNFQIPAGHPKISKRLKFLLYGTSIYVPKGMLVKLLYVQQTILGTLDSTHRKPSTLKRLLTTPVYLSIPKYAYANTKSTGPQVYFGISLYILLKTYFFL